MEISIQQVIDNITTVYDEQVSKVINHWARKPQTDENTLMAQIQVEQLRSEKELWINDIQYGNTADVQNVTEIFKEAVRPETMFD